MSTTSKRSPSHSKWSPSRGDPAEVVHHEPAERAEVAALLGREGAARAAARGGPPPAWCRPPATSRPRAAPPAPSRSSPAGGMSPTIASSTSLSVTSPSMPPYSSTTRAKCVPRRLEPLEQGERASCSPGRAAAGAAPPQVDRTRRDGAGRRGPARGRSRGSCRARPALTGKREYGLRADGCARSPRARRSTSSHTTLTRGVISESTRRSPRRNTRSTMRLLGSSNIPASGALVRSAA